MSTNNLGQNDIKTTFFGDIKVTPLDFSLLSPQYDFIYFTNVIYIELSRSKRLYQALTIIREKYHRIYENERGSVR